MSPAARRIGCLLLAIGSFPAAAGGQPRPVAAPWPLDEMTLVNGAKFQGLILSEVGARVRFQTVRRQPGRPTVTLTDTFSRAEIASLRRLSDADRKALQERLAELDPTGKGEQERMDALELAEVEWLGRPGGARRYESDYFALTSGASDEVTRRAAVRLEQIYTAFARVMPPTGEGRPTAIELAPDAAEYRALLSRAGFPKLLNPAVFDPRANRILCGYDLRRLGAELQAARAEHRRQVEAVNLYEQNARRLFKASKAELERHLEAAARERRKVLAADRANEDKFNAATAQLFAVLYHEAFHAYVSAFVYRPLPPEAVAAGKGTGAIPRWLNEGLAQVFETAVVEAGELRADHADRARLARAQDRLRAKPPAERLVPLSDLLLAGGDLFRAAHADQAAASDRAYLTAWAVAHYLTFGRRAIGGRAFEKYAAAVNGGADPRAAFAALVGQPLPAFEAEWHSYLARLQPDGSVLPEKK